jgi:hypothetical protein
MNPIIAIGGLLSILVLIHFFVDWILQTHAEAMRKHNNAPVRARHCFIYATGFLPFIIYCFHPNFSIKKIITIWMILFFTHFFEDTYYPVLLWAKYIRKPPELRFRVQENGSVFYYGPMAAPKSVGLSIDTIEITEGEADVVGYFRFEGEKKTQRELDKQGFLKFIDSTLGKILMIAVDQIFHIVCLLPVIWILITSCPQFR